MKVRKIYARGGSYEISLPAAILAQVNWRKGDALALIPFDTNLLILIPVSRLDIVGNPEVNGKRIQLVQPEPAIATHPA